MGVSTIPALDRLNSNNIFGSSCGINSTKVDNIKNSINPKFIKILDILGRETQPQGNTQLFYIYDDGTVEKRIVIE